jgi:hypothetical protein
MIKLKTNKIFTREPRLKMRNQKNNNWSWNTNNQEDQAVIFKGGDRK